MASQIFRRFIIVLWVIAFISSVVLIFGATGRDQSIENFISIVVMCLVGCCIPLTLSYIFFGILNPIKLVKYKYAKL